MRVATLALLCASATAQHLYLAGAHLQHYDADTWQSQVWGDDGTITMLADWMAKPFVDYWTIPSFTSKVLTLVPERLGGDHTDREASTLGGNHAPNGAQGHVHFGPNGHVHHVGHTHAGGGAVPVPSACCSSTFYFVAYRCNHGPCTDGISGNMVPLLLADGWTPLTTGRMLCFSLPQTGAFNHETQVLVNTFSDVYHAPQSNGLTKYIGMFGTGCDEELTPTPPSQAKGPARLDCKDFCPPDSAGY